MPSTVWLDTLIDQQVGTGGQDTQGLMGTHAPATLRLSGLTLLRTIIGIDVAHLIHDSGEGSQDVTMGIGVASQEAFVASAIPDPNQTDDYPPRGWIWRARYRTYGFAADQAAVFNQRIDKDIRSRRKLDNGECYFVTNNSADQGTTGTINVIGLIRQLWLIT